MEALTFIIGHDRRQSGNGRDTSVQIGDVKGGNSVQPAPFRASRQSGRPQSGSVIFRFTFPNSVTGSPARDERI